MDIKQKECPYCGKIIQSLYDKQLDYNYGAHLLSCNSNTIKEVKEKDEPNRNEQSGDDVRESIGFKPEPERPEEQPIVPRDEPRPPRDRNVARERIRIS